MPKLRLQDRPAAKLALEPIVVLTLIGALLRFYDLGHQGLWYDEAYTSFLVRFSPGKMIGLIPSQESTPPFYYCVVWVWAKIFGNSPAGLRSLSALCGTATIPFAYAAAVKLLPSRRAALIAAVLTAFSPILIWYSQEARAYAMLVLFSSASLAAFAYARERPRQTILALWALSSALALATHYYAFLVVAPEGAWLLYEHRHSRAVRAAIAAVVVVGVALLPLLLTQTDNGNQTWITSVSIGERLAQVPSLFLIGTGSPARVLLKFVAFACVLLAIVLVWRFATARERRAAALPAGIALAGLLICVALLLAGNDTLLGRNLLPLWLPACVAVAAGLGAARARAAGYAGTAVLCAIGLVAVIGIDSNMWLQRPNWAPVAKALTTPVHAKFSAGSAIQYSPTIPAGRRIVIVQRNSGVFPLGLYISGLGYDRSTANTDVTEIDVVAVDSHPGLESFCWWGSACNLVPSRLQANYSIVGFRRVATVHVEQFAIVRLAASRPQTVTRAMLKQALVDTNLNNDAYLTAP